jgi:hypothetical protein
MRSAGVISRNMMLGRSIAGNVILGGLALAALAAACSGDDDAGDAAGGAGTSGNDGTDATSGGASGNGVSATGGGSATGGAGATGGGDAAGGSGGSGGSGTDGATCRDGSPSPCARTGGTGVLCTELGWCEITGTKLEDVCAASHGFDEVSGAEGCAGIINDWSGGIADTAHDRLIVWGGGHNGYYGNELYAFDLATREFQRLTDPSPPAPGGDVCPEELSDGTPNSRHTYNGLAEIVDGGQMWAFGGSLACGPGNFGDDTWLLDLGNLAWTRSEPASGPTPGPHPGVAADYDAATKKVFLHDTAALFRFDPATRTYERLGEDSIDYHLTGVIDPKRHLFVLFGGDQVRAFDISATSSYQMQTWDGQVTGCDAIRSAVYPGLAYDPVQDRIVGWAGGDTVYVFNVDTKACTAQTFAGGPGPQPTAGTHGRFRYFPKYELLAVVNGWQQNAFTLRLTP